MLAAARNTSARTAQCWMLNVGRLVNVALVTLLLGIPALAVFVRWLEPRFAFFPSSGETETPRHFGVDYEPLTIDTADGEHLRAWLMRAPSPRATIVYFHGNGGDPSILGPLLPGLGRRRVSGVGGALPGSRGGARGPPPRGG